MVTYFVKRLIILGKDINIALTEIQELQERVGNLTMGNVKRDEEIERLRQEYSSVKQEKQSLTK